MANKKVTIDEEMISEFSTQLALEIVNNSYEDVSELESLSEIIEKWIRKNRANFN